MERTLQALFAYNAWGNARVFDICRGVDPVLLDEPAPGTHGTPMETLKHLVRIEVLFMHLFRNEPLDLAGTWEEFNAHDLDWFAERAARDGQDYAALVASAGEGFYDEPLHVPWFDFSMTRRDGLLQVLSHSAHHRAQVFSALGARGVPVPDLDYVLLVESKVADQPPPIERSSTLAIVTAPASSASRRRWPWGRR